jgi:hypothetical protein
MAKVRQYPTYRGAEHTQSVLTITSNVVYGKHTGNTPDGRRRAALRPRRQPDERPRPHGVAASALSVAKLPYEQARDGISLTTTITPRAGHAPDERAGHLVGILDAYTAAGGFHMNVNVLDRATLEDAMEHPEKYPELDDPGVRLRRQLRPADPRAAARRDQPHLPRIAVSTVRTATTGRIHSWDLSTGVDGPGTRFVLFVSAARCAACTAPTPTPGTCATAGRRRSTR